MSVPAKFISRTSFNKVKQPLLLTPSKQPLLLTPSKQPISSPSNTRYEDPQKYKCNCSNSGIEFLDWVIIVSLILSLRKH